MAGVVNAAAERGGTDAAQGDLADAPGGAWHSVAPNPLHAIGTGCRQLVLGDLIVIDTLAHLFQWCAADPPNAPRTAAVADAADVGGPEAIHLRMGSQAARAWILAAVSAIAIWAQSCKIPHLLGECHPLSTRLPGRWLGFRPKVRAKDEAKAGAEAEAGIEIQAGVEVDGEVDVDVEVKVEVEVWVHVIRQDRVLSSCDHQLAASIGMLVTPRLMWQVLSSARAGGAQFATGISGTRSAGPLTGDGMGSNNSALGAGIGWDWVGSRSGQPTGDNRGGGTHGSRRGPVLPPGLSAGACSSTSGRESRVEEQRVEGDGWRVSGCWGFFSGQQSTSLSAPHHASTFTAGVHLRAQATAQPAETWHSRRPLAMSQVLPPPRPSPTPHQTPPPNTAATTHAHHTYASTFVCRLNQPDPRTTTHALV